MFFAAVALFASSALAATTTYTCSRNYTVSAGDTCDGISRAVSVSTYQLAMLNPAIDDACSNLEIGENLCLGLTDGSDCDVTYTVQGGDTCDGIAQQFAINGTYLGLNNPQIDDACDNIYVGEVLCVGNKLYQLPAAFTANNGANAPTPAIGVNTAVATASSSAVVSTTAVAANAAAAPGGSSAGVTLVSVTSVVTTISTPATSSTTTSSAAATPTASPDDDDEDCEDEED